MSDANFSDLAYIEEVIWGTTPAAPALKKMRITGESIIHDKTTVISEEVRSDRQISDMPEVGSEASGSVNFELSYEAFQPFLEAAFFNNIIVISETGTWDIITGVNAVETLTLAANVSADDTVTIDGKVYIFKVAPAAANEVDIGVDAETSIDNLVAAINEATGEGTLYGTGTVIHSTVTAAKATAATMTATAKSEGTGGNAIACTEASATASWGAAVLSGGIEPQIDGSATDFANIPVGATVKVAGSATAANNGLKLVTFKAVDTSSIQVARGSFAADTSTEGITLTGQHLPNGTTRKQFTLERRLQNSVENNFYQVYRGMMVNGLDMNFASKEIVTGVMSFLGKIGVDGASATIDDSGAYTDADAGDVVNATSHVGTFLIDREVTNERFKSLDVSVANNLRGKDAIGESGNFDVGVGSFEVTGSLNAYFQNQSFHEKFIGHSDVAVSFQITDPDGNTIVVTIPRMKLSTGSPNIEGKDTDVMIGADWTAIKDTLTNFTLAIDFHDA